MFLSKDLPTPTLHYLAYLHKNLMLRGRKKILIFSALINITKINNASSPPKLNYNILN